MIIMMKIHAKNSCGLCWSMKRSPIHKKRAPSYLYMYMTDTCMTGERDPTLCTPWICYECVASWLGAVITLYTIYHTASLYMHCAMYVPVPVPVLNLYTGLCCTWCGICTLFDVVCTHTRTGNAILTSTMACMHCMYLYLTTSLFTVQ